MLLSFVLKSTFNFVCGTTKNVNQAKLLGSMLKKMSHTEESLKKTAIILPNENLLLSVLESIPAEIKNINITIGYKLEHHPITSIFDFVKNFTIHDSVVKINFESSYILFSHINSI